MANDKFQNLVQDARDIAKGRRVLYFGTRCPLTILRNSKLPVYKKFVWFTPTPEVAAACAIIRSEPGKDEGIGAILVFDWKSLNRKYRFKRLREPEDQKLPGKLKWNALRVRGKQIKEVSPHLLGVAVFGVPEAARTIEAAHWAHEGAS